MKLPSREDGADSDPFLPKGFDFDDVPTTLVQLSTENKPRVASGGGEERSSIRRSPRFSLPGVADSHLRKGKSCTDVGFAGRQLLLSYACMVIKSY